MHFKIHHCKPSMKTVILNKESLTKNRWWETQEKGCQVILKKNKSNISFIGMVKLSKTKQAVRTQSIHCCFSTDNEGLGGQACAADQAPCHSPLVFHCYSGEGIYVWGGGRKTTWTGQKPCMWTQSKSSLVLRLEKSACTGLLCMSAATRAKVWLPGKGSGESSDRLEQS